ncbi:MAG: polymer-forming cytoskeletal protein [Actinomycetota bacterium]
MRTPRTVRSVVAGAALAAILVTLVAAPAAAGTGPAGGTDRNRRIGIGDLEVPAGTSVNGPLVGIDGRAQVDGTVDGAAIVVRGTLVVSSDGVVDGDVLILRGDARIDGRVDGDVTVLRGRAVLSAGAVVRGNVRSTEAPSIARGAQVDGDVRSIDVVGIVTALGAGLLLLWWLAVTVSTAALGAILLVLFPLGFETAAGVGRRRWWSPLLIGLAIVLGLPVVGVVALGSLVGLPLGLGVLGALGLLHTVGYVAGAFFLGRLILRAPKSRFGAFFLGWAILRILALVPLLGLLAWIVATAGGVGLLVVAGVGAGRGSRRGDPDAPPAPTVPTAPTIPAPEVTP